LNRQIKTFWLSALVFIIGLLISQFSSYLLEKKLVESLQDHLNSQTSILSEQIQRRINLYINTLRSGAEVLDKGHAENFDERFLLFCQSQRFQNVNTGINEIGFIPAISLDPPLPQNKISSLCSVPNGTLIPVTKEVPINPTFFDVLKQPIGEGQVVASDLLEVSFRLNTPKADGQIFYYPIGNYDSQMQTKLVGHPKLIGWLFLILRKSYLAERLKIEQDSGMKVRIETLETKSAPASLIYESAHYKEITQSAHAGLLVVNETIIPVAGKSWKLYTSFTPAYLDSYIEKNKTFTWISGITISAFAAMLFAFLRLRYLAKRDLIKGMHTTPEINTHTLATDLGDVIDYASVAADGNATNSINQAGEASSKLTAFDDLTSLPNSFVFSDRILTEMHRAKRDNFVFAVVCFSIDKLDTIIDAYGQPVANELMVQIGKLATDCVRTTDTVSRLENNLFAVLISQQHEIKNLTHVAYKILDSISGSVALSQRKLSVGISLGMAIFPNDSSSVEELLVHANEARKEAESLGGNQLIFYSRPLGEVVGKRRVFAREIREAINSKQLAMRFQPVVDVTSGRFMKAEALIRWISPEDGEIKPQEFIAIAEEAGLIVEIGNFVFTETVNFLKKWRNVLPEGFQISVNLSPQQLKLDPHITKNWLNLLQEKEVSTRSILLEITEGMLLDDDRQVINSLFELRSAGIQFCLDDFGTGHSSIAYLKKLDISYIKIDQSFVRDLANNVYDQKIVEGILLFAKKLGVQSVAEGIENKAQYDYLRQFQCEFCQGFYFARPMLPEELIELLKER